jgi:hypothetical protein
MAEEKNEEPKKVKVIVQNWQDGNRQFPGFKRKYKELYDIPGGSYDERAIVVEVDEEDFDEIVDVMKQQGILVQDYEQLEDEKRTFFGKVFSKVFGSKENEENDDSGDDKGSGSGETVTQKPSDALLEQWAKAFRALKNSQKKEFKGFNPAKATNDELKQKIIDAEMMNNK